MAAKDISCVQSSIAVYLRVEWTVLVNIYPEGSSHLSLHAPSTLVRCCWTNAMSPGHHRALPCRSPSITDYCHGMHPRVSDGVPWSCEVLCRLSCLAVRHSSLRHGACLWSWCLMVPHRASWSVPHGASRWVPHGASVGPCVAVMNAALLCHMLLGDACRGGTVW